MSLGNQARRRHHVDCSSTPSASLLPALHPPQYHQHSGKGTRLDRAGHIVYRKPNRWKASSKRRGNRFLPRVLFVGVTVIIVVYGALFLRLNYLLRRESKGSDSVGYSFHENYLSSRYHSGRPLMQGDAAKRVMDYLSSEQSTSGAIQRRLEERYRKTSPPPFGTTVNDLEKYEKLSKPYGFDFLEGGASVIHEKTERFGETNDMTTRCGIDAQNAFSANPSSYPDIHAVNEDSVVLITGILGRIGFHLALKLATQCNAQVLIGVDSIYPNDSKYKLQLLQKLSTLYSQLPNFKEPFFVTFDGINPKQCRHFEDLMDDKTGDFDYATFAKPTHVVHLISAEEDSYLTRDNSIGGDSPYNSNDGLFGLRQSLVATEQLLNSLGYGTSQLHFTFVSDVDVLKLREKGLADHWSANSHAKKHHRGMFTATKFMEEVLLHLYAEKLKNHSFVILRLPIVYGPGGKPGSFDHDLAQKAISHWHDKGTMDRELGSQSILLQLTGQSEQSQLEHDIIFVDDAINAIVSGMQFGENDSNAASFNIVSGEKTSISNMADLIESYMPISTHVKTKPHIDSIHDRIGHYSPPDLALDANNQLHWAPRTFLREGVKQLLGWHLDEHLPFGPPLQFSSGQDSMLSATETGQAFHMREGDGLCDPDDTYCLRGHRIFPCSSECSDPSSCIKSPFDRAADVSRQLTENCEVVLYMDNLDESISNLSVTAPESDASEAICNLAFILKSSNLAKSWEGEMYDKDTFSYKGWKIILIDSSEDDISTELDFMLKMSPSKFFHSSVKSALYIPEDFSTSPEVDDIIFTTDLLRRKRIEVSSAHYVYAMNKMNYKVGDDERTALIVMPGALTVEEQRVGAVFSGSAPTKAKKIHLDKALQTLIDHSSERARRHVQFDRGVNSFLNRHDFENPDTISPKFLHEHWTRSHWVAHNFEMAEARNLRCEWYREHTKWGDENDSLSFSHVMARLEIERFNNLFDDEEKAEILDEQRMNDISMETDEYEWHKVQDRDSKETLYARIVDDRALIIERRLWKIMDELDIPKIKHELLMS